MSNIWWSSLPERGGVASDQVYNCMLDVAMNAGRNGYDRISISYTRTDFARNEICKAFKEKSTRDNDLLIMLDADHKYPADILERFAAHDPALGVVGALAFRRGTPYDPLFFVRANGGGLHSLAGFEYGPVYQCAIVSTSAISIRRWVLIELEHKGYLYPWFRYEYPTNSAQPSEDMYFGRICEQAGIWHYCDTSLVIPHLSPSYVDADVHQAWLANHPQAVGETVQVDAK